jgi:hypothetical protein
MADYDSYDPRIDSLVVETRTEFAPSLSSLSEEEKLVIGQAIQRHPQLASSIRYERTHTGFIRHVTVSEVDIEKLYHHNSSLAGT